MKSAGNEGVVQNCLQMLHIHVFLAAPLSTSHVAQPRADQHQGRVPVRESPHHTSAAADLLVQSLNNIVGAHASPVFTGKITVGQRFLNAVLHLLCSLLQLYGTQFLHYSLGFLSSCFLALLGMDRQSLRSKVLASLAASLALERGVIENTLR